MTDSTAIHKKFLLVSLAETLCLVLSIVHLRKNQNTHTDLSKKVRDLFPQQAHSAIKKRIVERQPFVVQDPKSLYTFGFGFTGWNPQMGSFLYQFSASFSERILSGPRADPVSRGDRGECGSQCDRLDIQPCYVLLVRSTERASCTTMPREPAFEVEGPSQSVVQLS